MMISALLQDLPQTAVLKLEMLPMAFKSQEPMFLSALAYLPISDQLMQTLTTAISIGKAILMAQPYSSLNFMGGVDILPGLKLGTLSSQLSISAGYPIAPPGIDGRLAFPWPDNSSSPFYLSSSASLVAARAFDNRGIYLVRTYASSPTANEVAISAVPVPSSILVFCLGAVGMVFANKKRS
jgi:hypothetical protein